MYWVPALLLATFVAGAQAQATAQTSVAPSLRECYTDPALLNRNNLAPANINVLIDIIRRIEDDPNVNIDLRTMAALLLHTYRQDGIQYHARESTVPLSANVLPFSPTFHSFHRHRLLLRMIPSNLQTLPNDTIPAQFKCALHHMLSTTLDTRLRGDETNCGQLSQYRALRTSRIARSVDDDVEILDVTKLTAHKNGHMQQSPDSDVEYTDSFGARSSRQIATSPCPILTGVVNTRWGAVSAGNLIAGIAAGAEAQQVPVLELTKGSVLNYQNVQPMITTIYPATMSGDLAEAILIQGTRGNSAISIGSAGNWNSSQATRYYMLSNQLNIEMSDPEIRGGIDGFVLGSTLTQTLGTSSTLRLSQLLDMYYTPENGVFNSDLRACNRRVLSQSRIDTNVLSGETRAFTAVLDSVMPLEGTLTGGLDGLVSSSISNFQTYLNSNINDLNCVVGIDTRGLHRDTRFSTKLYIALDASWNFNAIYPAISFILDSIEVNKYGSSITLLSAFDGSVIMSETRSLAEFHSNYTLTRHQTLMTGVNLEVSLANIRGMMQAQLRNESAANYVGGNATVLLYLLNSVVQNNQNILEQSRLLNEQVPDLRLFFGTATNQVENLSNLVRDSRNDIVTINLNTAGTNVEDSMIPLLDRIQTVGRRVINPLCGSDFAAASSGTRQFNDNVEPGYINYYRVSPNYFFRDNGNTRIRVVRTGMTGGALTVCHSRSVVFPRANATIVGADPSEINCQSLTASGNIEINLSEACASSPYIGACPPLHFSVQAAATTASTTAAVCTNINECRFPYNVMYQIQVQDLQCFSSAASVASSILFVVLGFLFNMHRSL